MEETTVADIIGKRLVERIVYRVCHRSSTGVVLIGNNLYLVKDAEDARRRFVDGEFVGQFQGLNKTCRKTCSHCRYFFWQSFSSQLDIAYHRVVDRTLGKVGIFEDVSREIDHNYKADWQGRITVAGRVLPHLGAQ